MSLHDFAAGLQSTALSATIQSTSWLIPALQAIHILMIGVVFGSILMLTLRVLGLMRNDEPFERVWRRFAPFLWCGLAVMALTGCVLILGEPVRELMSLSFRLKMLLLAVCIVSAAMLGRRIGGLARPGDSPTASGAAPEAAPALPGTLRVAAAATLGLWLAIIFLGRAIAYDSAVWGAWSPIHAQATSP